MGETAAIVNDLIRDAHANAMILFAKNGRNSSVICRFEHPSLGCLEATIDIQHGNKRTAGLMSENVRPIHDRPITSEQFLKLFF
jgi:hypothetical protein